MKIKTIIEVDNCHTCPFSNMDNEYGCDSCRMKDIKLDNKEELPEDKRHSECPLNECSFTVTSATNNNKPPKPPLGRAVRQGVGVICDYCHSTMSKQGFLGSFGNRLCDNDKCPSNKYGTNKS